jgi:hypothetical protein
MILNFAVATETGHELLTVEIDDDQATDVISDINDLLDLPPIDDRHPFDDIVELLTGYNYIMKESELFVM